VIEHRNLRPGSPPLHLHLNQEEWFYVFDGRVKFIVGEKTLTLGAGESVLAPRRVAHTFSSTVSLSHVIIAFAPAGKMEEYFRDANGNGALACPTGVYEPLRHAMDWSISAARSSCRVEAVEKVRGRPQVSYQARMTFKGMGDRLAGIRHPGQVLNAALTCGRRFRRSYRFRHRSQG
jgi:hypothetical protein